LKQTVWHGKHISGQSENPADAWTRSISLFFISDTEVECYMDGTVWVTKYTAEGNLLMIERRLDYQDRAALTGGWLVVEKSKDKLEFVSGSSAGLSYRTIITLSRAYP
jgi:hypothetical protein